MFVLEVAISPDTARLFPDTTCLHYVPLQTLNTAEEASRCLTWFLRHEIFSKGTYKENTTNSAAASSSAAVPNVSGFWPVNALPKNFQDYLEAYGGLDELLGSTSSAVQGKEHEHLHPAQRWRWIQRCEDTVPLV